MDKTEKFIEKAKQICDLTVDFSLVKYVNSTTKIQLICHKCDKSGKEHGVYETTPSDCLKGRRCPKCANENRGPRKEDRLTTEKFIERAKETHGDRYDYSDTIYENARVKLKIRCLKHGIFEQLPHAHLSGQGCPVCSGKRKKTREDVVESFKKVHGRKYIYDGFDYVDTKTKGVITCPIHGEFRQSFEKHIIGQGCPHCAKVASKAEVEIIDFLHSLGVNNIEHRNRTIIQPLELDIYLPEHKLAIEYNGLLWHSEKFGKDSHYHIDKLNKCNEHGVRLITIFEDEYLRHKEIVLNKIKHILGFSCNEKIYGRKCIIKEITKTDARDFLEQNHIQGYVPSSVYVGAYCNDRLVGVMTFKVDIRKRCWELNRCATDINIHCIGVCGKMFKWFIKEYKPKEVKSFADRRWTVNTDRNLYTNMCFSLANILKPDYSYMTPEGERIHKFNFRRSLIMKRYPNAKFTVEMTEKEMCDLVGVYRIWNCGLLKYVWKKDKKKASKTTVDIESET